MRTRDYTLPHQLHPASAPYPSSLPPPAWNALVREVKLIEQRFTHPTLLRRAWISMVNRIDRLLSYGIQEGSGRRSTSLPTQ